MEISASGGAEPAVPNINQALAKLLTGHGTMADQATVMTGSATNLVSAAGTGFKLDPEAATALIASCDESLDLLRKIEMDLYNVREAPRLGDTKGAHTVSTFTQKVANDPQGIVSAVANLQATITQMRQAYQKAVANYHAVEQNVTDAVSKLTREVQQENAPVPQHGRMRAI